MSNLRYDVLAVAARPAIAIALQAFETLEKNFSFTWAVHEECKNINFTGFFEYTDSVFDP